MSARGHILLVEDNDATRYAVTRILTNSGYAVTASGTGERGLALAAAARPDLVLLDVKLPDVSGFEVCRRLKADPETRAIPVVHLSATSISAAEQVQGLEGGADAYLTHPIEPRLLIATLDALLRAHRAEAALLEASRRKDEFLAVLSHELRNPLAPIRNAIALLHRVAPDGPEADRARQILDRQTEHLARIVEDLLDVTRIARGKIELKRARVDLCEVVRDTCDDLASTFGEAGVHLRVDASGGPVWVDADPTRVAQIVGNLLHNATKFTPAGAGVTVSVGAAGDRAEVRVRDEGVGIEPAQVMGMFEPFAQGELGLSRTTGGLGLGLALVRGLTELHGGAVTATSDGLGRGAEFTVQLPRAAAPADAGPADAGPRGARALRVLVVDDNDDADQSLADLLALDGHQVATAHDGRGALAAATAQPPDVVLCDIGLPDLDGYEVARRFRADAALGRARLVAVSGYATAEDRARASDAGFDFHVAKPPRLDLLVEILQEVAAGA